MMCNDGLSFAAVTGYFVMTAIVSGLCGIGFGYVLGFIGRRGVEITVDDD